LSPGVNNPVSHAFQQRPARFQIGRRTSHPENKGGLRCRAFRTGHRSVEKTNAPGPRLFGVQFAALPEYAAVRIQRFVGSPEA